MVRVRFAPSPTGDLHVGGLRTALYNFLFARKADGRFILRIEDTDRRRHVPGAVTAILETLRKCELNPDEGPEIGGDFGPYIQSQRLHLYREAADRLLSEGHAYPCFCSSGDLEMVRADKPSPGETAGYDRKCRKLDPAEAAERMKSESHVLRLKVPLEGEIQHDDLVWGRIRFPFADVDDQILMKSDGYPTYHLANVVDDGLMKITHVIRGEEWLPSIPKHLLLYRYLEMEPPQFAHLPLILNEKRQKLSKREGAGSVANWLDKGILPQALVNYVALLGWHPADGREIFDLEELIQAFSLDRVGKAGAVFDPEKLEWTSSEHMKRIDSGELAELAAPFLRETEFSKLRVDVLQNLLDCVRSRLHRLDELPETLAPYSSKQPVPDEEAQFWLSSDSARKLLPLVLKVWKKEIELNADSLLDCVRTVGKESGIKGKDLWMPIRAALTGRTSGPELKTIAAHLGAQEMISRLEKIARDVIENSGER